MLNFASFLVIGIVGLVFLIGVGHVVRGQHGARAERRFWLRLGIMVLIVGVASTAAYGLLPMRYHNAASLALSGVSLPVIWFLFLRNEHPSA